MGAYGFCRQTHARCELNNHGDVTEEVLNAKCIAALCKYMIYPSLVVCV